ncbi:MAG: GNAT family N-acetyltransferase [Acidimicrobiales bacterium]
MENSFGLRRYDQTDLAGVLALCAHEQWASYTEDRVRAHRVFTAPGVVAVVATGHGEIVGFAYFQSDGAIQAHLSLLVVEQANRRAGIARALVNYAFTLLHALRIDLITDDAGVFYRELPHKEQLGFRLYPSSSVRSSTTSYCEWATTG